MKKGMLIVIIFMLFGITIPVHDEVESHEEYQTIPDEAIRLRILANSDSEEDQYIKRLVRDEVNEYISELVQYVDDINDARKMIHDHVPEIEEIVQDTLKTAEASDIFEVEYDSNVSFPTKIYDNFVYPAGEYEAVLISIGEAQGANWWCVLFPPLCFLDFSNGATVEEAQDTETEETDTQDLETEDQGSETEDSEKNSEKTGNNAEEHVEDEEENEEKNNEAKEEDVADKHEEEVEVSFFLLEWLGLS